MINTTKPLFGGDMIAVRRTKARAFLIAMQNAGELIAPRSCSALKQSRSDRRILKLRGENSFLQQAIHNIGGRIDADNVRETGKVGHVERD